MASKDKDPDPGTVITPPPLVSAQVVAYIGTSSERIIGEESWDAAGVHGQKTIIWCQQNHWQVLIDQFTDDALAWITANEPELVIKTVQIPAG